MEFVARGRPTRQRGGPSNVETLQTALPLPAPSLSWSRQGPSGGAFLGVRFPLLPPPRRGGAAAWPSSAASRKVVLIVEAGVQSQRSAAGWGRRRGVDDDFLNIAPTSACSG